MPTFAELFGHPPLVTASAPGRVNLIGEHTDYNDGLMLPMPIPHRTTVELGRTDGTIVRAWSENLGDHGGAITYVLGTEARRGHWIDFAQGVTAALREAGAPVGGFDARISSAVPLGSGLSSSAALLVALLRALREAFTLALDDTAIARIAHRAEVAHVGVPVGIMDQMVCSLGRPGHALLIDARSLDVAHVRMPPDCDIIVIDSNVRHSHVDGEYRTRRAECEHACTRLGVRSLRNVTPEALAGPALRELPETLRRRVRHVVSENARVGRMADALRAGDLIAAGRLLSEGHASLRDDYQVSTTEIDTIVAIAEAEPAILGGRLTGGGFGGSIVALARKGEGRPAADRVAATYHTRTGATATVLMPFVTRTS